MHDPIDPLVRTAVHEAGHAVVGLIFFPDDIHYASIEQGEGFLGMVAMSDRWNQMLEDSLERFHEQQAVFLAGRAAEELICRDYQRAGLLKDEEIAYEAFYGYWRSHRDLGLDEVEVGETALALARRTLEKERALLNAVAVALALKTTIPRERLLFLLEKFGTKPR